MRALGNLLLGLGILLLVATVGMYGYGEYERLQAEEAFRDIERRETATAVAEGAINIVATARAGRPVATTTAVAGLAPGIVAQPGFAVASVPHAAAPVEATATPAPTQIRRIVAPSIGLDSPVVEAKIENGEWSVPKFVAGYLEGTGLPGKPGNVVLSGHVQSLTSGNVFSRIEELKPGDTVTLRTTNGELSYRITGKNVVPNDDLTVVKGSQAEEITLITCTGTFNPLTSDYSHRIVVWGERGAA